MRLVLHIVLAFTFGFALVQTVNNTDVSFAVIAKAAGLCIVLLLALARIYQLPQQEGTSKRPRAGRLTLQVLTVFGLVTIASYFGWMKSILSSGWGPIGVLSFLLTATVIHVILLLKDERWS